MLSELEPFRSRAKARALRRLSSWEAAEKPPALRRLGRVRIGAEGETSKCIVMWIEFLRETLIERTVADGGAFLVGGQEGGFVDAGPEGFALGGEGFDGVEVGAKLERAAVGGG